MDGYYLLTTKSAPSRFPTFRKDRPIVEASREDGGKETVPGSRKQGCVHPDSTDVSHMSPALGPDATCAGPLSHPPENPTDATNQLVSLAKEEKSLYK